MNRVNLSKNGKSSNQAVLDILLGDLGISGFSSVIGVALNVKVDLFIQVFNFGFKSGTSANLIHEILVGLELLVLELGLIGNNLINLLLLVAALFGLGTKEQVFGVNETGNKGNLLFGGLLGVLLLLDTHLN